MNSFFFKVEKVYVESLILKFQLRTIKY